MADKSNTAMGLAAKRSEPGPADGSGIIRGWRGLKSRIPKSRAQIWRDIRAGRFPAPIELGPNAVGWHVAEVEAIDDSDEGVLAASIIARRRYDAMLPSRNFVNRSRLRLILDLMVGIPFLLILLGIDVLRRK